MSFLDPRRFAAPYGALWALWLVIALGVTQGRPLAWLLAPPPAATQSAEGYDVELNNVFGDAPRYFAYAQAMQGRPYDSFYVRPLAQWRQARDETHLHVTPERPLIPWRDFSMEYPPGALIALLPPALIASGPLAYSYLFGIEMAAALTLAMALGVRAAELLRPGAGKVALTFGLVYFGFVAAQISLHYDAMVALTLAWFAYAVASRRPMSASLALTFGVLVKGVPAALIPLAFIHFLRCAPQRGVAFAAALAAALLGAAGGLYLLVAGPGAYDMLAYHAERPVQVQSPYGALALLAYALGGVPLEIVYSFGSNNISAAFEPALRAPAAPLTALAIAAAFVWRLRRVERDGPDAARATLAAANVVLIAYMGLGKVFSPQYLLWLLPFVVVPAAAGAEAALPWLFATLLAAWVEYPFAYYWSPAALGVAVLVRDALLGATALRLLFRPRAKAVPVAGTVPVGANS